MKDYYKTLGVEKTATKDELKKAFYKLAHKYHPDVNKNNPDAAKKFKEASEAYAILSDDTKRGQYDRFGSAGPGGAGFNAGQQGGYGGQGGFGGFNGGQGFGGFDFSQFTQGGGFNQGGNGQSFEFDLGDLFGEFFGGGGRGRRPRKGMNVTVDIQISFKDSIFGIEKELSIGGRKEKLVVKIPAGIESGQGLRVAGKGEEGQVNSSGEKGPSGDLIVRVWVEEHPNFRKEGFNLIMDLPVKLTTAIAGGTIEIKALNPEVDGTIELKIPAGTSHGEILRLRGKGVPYETRGAFTGNTHEKRGDLLVVTHVQMPKKLSKNAERLVDELKGEGI
jgi:DnaJ-class molecular chaperone